MSWWWYNSCHIHNSFTIYPTGIGVCFLVTFKKNFFKSLSVKIKKYENFFLIMLSIWWALFLYFEKYMYDTDSIFGYIDAKFVSFNHVFYDINNILCLTPINRLLFSSKPGHSFDVYCYSRLLVGVFSAETVFMNWWVLLPIWLSQKAIFSHQICSDQLRQHFVWGQCFTSVSPCP